MALRDAVMKYLSSGVTQGEFASQAGISTRALSAIRIGTFGVGEKPDATDPRKRTGMAETLTRLSIFLGLKPESVIRDDYSTTIGWDSLVETAIERTKLASLGKGSGESAEAAITRLLSDESWRPSIKAIADALLNIPAVANESANDLRFVWRDWATAQLEECSSRLKSIRAGEIKLQTRMQMKEFWSDEIMAKATSVWTTNLAWHPDSFALGWGPVRLSVQTDAIIRGAEIHRVFIKKGNDDSLKKVMSSQFEVGIQVSMIEEDSFDKIYDANPELREFLQSQDVMLVNDWATYITNWDQKTPELATSAVFSDNKNVLKAARHLRELVNVEAKHYILDQGYLNQAKSYDESLAAIKVQRETLRSTASRQESVHVG